MSNLIVPTYRQGFARYADESEAPNLWRGLVGAWLPFLGPTGLMLRDQSGFGNHGTLTDMDAATGWVTSIDKQGRGIYALDFDGSYDHVDCGNVSQINGIGAITVSVWIYPHSLAANDLDPVHKWAGAPYGVFDLRLDYDALKHRPTFTIHTVNEAHPDVYGTVYLQDVGGVNNWYHLVGIYDLTGIFKIYLNGEDISGIPEEATGILYANDPNSLKLGSAFVDTFFHGLISDVRIYNRALTPSEVWKSYIDPYAMYRRKLGHRYVAAIADPDLVSATHFLLPSYAKGLMPSAIDQAAMQDVSWAYSGVLAEAPGEATLIAQERGAFRRIHSRIFGRVN